MLGRVLGLMYVQCRSDHLFFSPPLFPKTKRSAEPQSQATGMEMIPIPKNLMASCSPKSVLLTMSLHCQQTSSSSCVHVLDISCKMWGDDLARIHTTSIRIQNPNAQSVAAQLSLRPLGWETCVLLPHGSEMLRAPTQFNTEDQHCNMQTNSIDPEKNLSFCWERARLRFL